MLTAMPGKLNDQKLEELLRTKMLGRIGCHAGGITYVVPVHYAYEPFFIYTHSSDGLKISLMRKNREVCFEVDDISDFFNWQSVICWGTFEEITAIAEQQRAMQKIINRIEPFLYRKEDAHPSHGIADLSSEIGTIKTLVFYRLRVHRKTGRFEHRNLTPVPGQEQ
jgi:nitroimidazol reductase NimA-like FMN-containing flavoprotein (pyridoxamine 5'-phosphate oxidase superfamily)